MSGRMDKKGNRRGGVTVIVRRQEETPAQHHGGAWKVAYADFVTAMMAFFLLMWLLNATTEEQRRGIADYFSASNPLSHGESGSGKPFGGKTPFEHDALVSDLGAVEPVRGANEPLPEPDDDSDTIARPRPDQGGMQEGAGTVGLADSGQAKGGSANGEQAQRGQAHVGQAHAGQAHAGQASSGLASSGQANAGPGASGQGSVGKSGTDLGTAASEAVGQPNEQATQNHGTDAHSLTSSALRAELAAREQAAFEQAANQLRDAVRSDPALADLAKQLTIDQTPEGLRIQLLDEDKQPMFATGSSAPNERARALLQKIAPVLARLSEFISIAGHTDAAQYHGTDKSNWDLSTERANATRHFLVEAGVAENRFSSVSGYADRQPLLPADPLAAVNRRIAIVVLHSSPPESARSARAAPDHGASAQPASSQSQ
jgi:chemotaxis protein MotB